MTDHGLSRRELLVRSGVMAGGAVLLGAGGWGAARALGQSSPASTWPQPPQVVSSGGTLNTRFLVATAEVPIATQTAQAVVYEGVFPGPTLDIHAGDTLGINFMNRYTQPTNLHTHGLHVSPKKPSDDVLLEIEPDHSFQYRYEVPADHPGGTNWYHAHRHMLSDEQVSMGMFGMLIVRGALDKIEGIAGLPERQFVIENVYVEDGKIISASIASISQQSTLVNGRYQPVVEMATGDTQRWRLLNTSSVFLRLQLEDTPFHVIAIDGNALTNTEAHRIIVIPPGGRFDVLVQPSAAGTFELRSLSWDSLGVFWTSMVPVPQVIAKVVVTGDAPARPATLPTKLLPFDDLRHAHIDKRRTFRLEEREPRGTGDEPGFEYYINGLRFDPNRVNTQVPLNNTEEWEYINLTYEPHPLHIHINPFQVVAIDGDRSRGERHYRDSAVIPPFGSLTIRHRFLDYTGMFVMHCHILFHEDHGMMQLVEVYDPKVGPGPRHLPGKAGGHDHMTMMDMEMKAGVKMDMG